MTIFEKFKEMVPGEIENITEKKMMELLEKKEFQDIFSDFSNVEEIFSNLISILDGTEKENFLRAKCEIELEAGERKMSELFQSLNNKEIEIEEFKKELFNYRNNPSVLISLSSFLCTLVGTNADLLNEYENLREKVKETEKILNGLGPIESSYSVRCNIIDLLYGVREGYFGSYGKDILEGFDFVNEEILKLNNFKEKIEGNEIKDSGIPPEELGLIDITKVK